MNSDDEHREAGTPAASDPLPLSSKAGAKAPSARTHKVSAIYPNPEEAMAVSEKLKNHGFSAAAISVLQASPDSADGHIEAADDSDEVLMDILVDGAVGTGVGTGVGVLGTVVMLAADVTLFVASPVVATLAMVGWFAGLGGFLGAAVGSDDAARKEGKFAELVKDAIAAGNTVLLVRTSGAAETKLAKEIVKASLLGRDQAAMSSQ